MKSSLPHSLRDTSLSVLSPIRSPWFPISWVLQSWPFWQSIPSSCPDRADSHGPSHIKLLLKTKYPISSCTSSCSWFQGSCRWASPRVPSVVSHHSCWSCRQSRSRWRWFFHCGRWCSQASNLCAWYFWKEYIGVTLLIIEKWSKPQKMVFSFFPSRWLRGFFLRNIWGWDSSWPPLSRRRWMSMCRRSSTPLGCSTTVSPAYSRCCCSCCFY